MGMQELVDAVRHTGAKQPLLLGGVDWSNNLSEWLQYEPNDPLHQLIASVHAYSYTACNSTACWNGELAKVARQVPVVAGEFGATSCSPTFPKRFMKWADKHYVSYVAWAWLPGTCAIDGPLITDYSGTPTTYGTAVKDQLSALYAAGSGNVGSLTAATGVGGAKHKKK